MTDSRVLDAARRLREALTPADLDQTLANITAAAVEVLPDVQLASVTIKHADGRLDTYAPTDQVLCDVDAAQYDLQEGPCYEAATDTVHVTAPNLASDSRFPRYAPVALEAGIRAQAGIRHFDARGSDGALNLYSRQVGAFQDLAVLRELFAHQSALALDYAREVSNLKQAIESRQLIGQAVGMVMERYGMDEARSFALLSRLSQEQNVKLRDLARQMIDERASQD
jgi:hypothetical protein